MEEEKIKELSPQEMATKLNELETNINTLTQERDQARQERDTLQKQLNGLKITGLTRQVETISQPQVEEPIQFDFDL